MIVWILLCLVLPIVADTAWVALFRAKPAGRFKVSRESDDEIGFSSSTGIFVIKSAARTLAYASGRQRGVLSFDEIKGLEYRADEHYALLAELFFGFDGTDLLPRYRDTVDWYSIAVLATDGRRIPLFLSGEYQPREFLLGWYIELQAALLSRIGLLTDVEEQGWQALAAIQSHMPGVRLL